mmetsp:Transcript_94856/g.268518  ORF Transcript_94856/g.268518 Transcript_94856/m.268518 type:complete len:204 (+) Transcript_94856:266-877(+)
MVLRQRPGSWLMRPASSLACGASGSAIRADPSGMALDSVASASRRMSSVCPWRVSCLLRLASWRTWLMSSSSCSDALRKTWSSAHGPALLVVLAELGQLDSGRSQLGPAAPLPLRAAETELVAVRERMPVSWPASLWGSDRSGAGVSADGRGSMLVPNSLDADAAAPPPEAAIQDWALRTEDSPPDHPEVLPPSPPPGPPPAS